MFNQGDDEYGFWNDEPTRPLERLSALRRPAGAPVARPKGPTVRPRGTDGPAADDTRATRRLARTPAPTPMPEPDTSWDDQSDDAWIDAWKTVPSASWHDTRSETSREHTGSLPRTVAQPNVARRSLGQRALGQGSLGQRFGGRSMVSGPAGRSHGNTQQVPVVADAPGRNAAPAARPLATVDPLLRRMGMLALAVTLCVPVAMALRGDDQQGAAVQSQTTTLAVGDASTDGAAASDTLQRVVPLDAVATDQAAAQPSPDAPAATQPVAAEEPATSNAQPASTDTAAPVSAAQPRTEAAPAASCSSKYTVVSGDYWILIAKKHSVTTAELLSANKATTATAIFPGGTVCLPANASAPTTATPTTATPTTVRPTPTTAAPTTTAPPATTVPVKTSYTRAEVEAIIREVWPDHLETEALRIATRESNLQPTAKNYCCYGLFQIYFNVHKSWLANIGITSAAQLLDPRNNAVAAYFLYNRAGGWGPWAL